MTLPWDFSLGFGETVFCFFVFFGLKVKSWLQQIRGKCFSRSGKSEGILFWIRKNWHFEERTGKIEIIEHGWFNTIEGWKKHKFGALWSERYFSLMKKEICWKLSLLVNYWKKKPLLDLIFCVSLFGEILFLWGKSQSILKRHVCGNHETVNLCKTFVRLATKQTRLKLQRCTRQIEIYKL